VNLARELALAESTDRTSGGKKCNSSPTLSLVEHCLKISESLLQSQRPCRQHDAICSQIAAVLTGLAAGQAEEHRRAVHALAVLHFAERTLGLRRPASKGGTRTQAVGGVTFAEGRNRARACGTYSTPDFIVDSMLTDLFSALKTSEPRIADILDLSLEGGHFALGTKRVAPQRQKVRFHGVDQDPVAIELAVRILRFESKGDRSYDFLFKSACQDSLLNPLPRGWPLQYDAVIGNPPWTVRKWNESNVLRKKFWPFLRGHYDLYLAFMLRAHSLLKPGGFLSYVVPSGFLFNCTAGPVRRLLLEEYDILSLTMFPQRSFIEVPCIIPVSFLARRREPHQKNVAFTTIRNIEVGLGGPHRPHSCSRVRVAEIWKRLPDCGMNPVIRKENEFLVSGLQGTELEKFGKVSSGARLGRTNQHCSLSRFKALHACDLRPFHACFRRGDLFAKDDAAFDRSPDQDAIDSHKVVFQELRYMTHRQRLVAAVAGPGTLAVSTAGFFLPANSGDSLFFAALLNSALANAWYKVRDLNRAIKISYLRQLPVREHPKTWRSISVLAMECVSLRTFFHKRMNSCTLKEEASRLSVRFPEEWCRLVEHQREIDQKIFELYEISKARREAILRLTATRVF
jgi:hypothetical protein